MSASSRPDEAARLEALESYRILDTPREEAFDRITRLAAGTFDVPFAALNLIDDTRCFFKSVHGADVREVPLHECTPCLTTLRTRTTLVVPDAAEDDRFRGFPWIAESPWIRFYATTPLYAPDGFVLGTLFIADAQPHDGLSEREVEQLEAFAAIAADLLTAHRAVQRLATTEGIREAVTDNVADVIFSLSPAGEFTYLNPAYAVATGLDREAWLGRRFEDLVDPEDRDELRASFARVLRGERVRSDVVVSTPDGMKTFDVIVVPNPEDVDAPVVGIARDLTDRERKDLALREAEARYQAIFDNSLDGVMRTSPDGPILEMNQAMLDMLGHTAEDVRAHPLHRSDIVDSSDPRLPEALETRRRTGRVRGELTYKRADGTTFPVEVTSSIYLDPDGSERTVIIARDVTDQKRAEAEAKQEREFTDATINSLPGVFYVHDGERLVRWNRNAERVTGYSAAELATLALADFVEETELLLERTHEALTRGSASMEANLVTKHGERIPYIFTGERAVLNDRPYLVGVGTDVTEWKRSQEALRRTQDQLARAEDSALVMTTHISLEGRWLKIPPALCDLLGYTEPELEAKPVREIMHPDDWEAMQEARRQIRSGQIASYEMEKRYIRRDGRVVWVYGNDSIVRDDQGEPSYLLAYIRDITEQKRAQQALHTRARQQAAVARLSHFVLSRGDLQGMLDEAAEIATEVLEMEFGGVLEVPPDGHDLLLRSGAGCPSPSVRVARDAEAHSVVESTLAAREPVVITDVRTDPRVAPADRLRDYGVRSGVWVAIPGRDRPFGTIGVFSRTQREFSEDDARFLQSIANLLSGVIEQRLLLDELAHRAEHDDLTDLPNRAAFVTRLEGAIAEAERDGTMLAVLFLDLDRFKNINDSLGHHAGDELLKTIPRRLSSLTRGDDVLARLAGDEFVMVLRGVQNQTQVAEITSRILQAFDEPFLIAGQRITVKATAGISVYPEDAQDAASLLRGADAAMYHGKTFGRNTFQFFTSAMNAAAAERLELESNLRQALYRNEFELHYQPQVDLATNTVVGFEALLRWHHPERGVIAPDRFIPIAEDTGLIVPIGEWVMREAFGQLRAWKDAGVSSLRMAVNVAAPQFTQVGFTAIARRITKEAGLEPKDVELEITESVVLHDRDLIAKELTVLEALGFRVAIDDFGTGYSSLAYLRDLPIDRIKIDRAFTSQIDRGEPDRGAAFVEAMIRLAKSLHLEVVAEGIETGAQVEMLRELGCDEGQGYLFAKPMPAADVPVWLEGASRRGAWKNLGRQPKV